MITDSYDNVFSVGDLFSCEDLDWDDYEYGIVIGLAIRDTNEFIKVYWLGSGDIVTYSRRVSGTFLNNNYTIKRL